MARDISVTIAVQGEKEYAQALRDAQSAVKLLESELKASEASFGDNADAQERYANRTRLIGAQIEQQKTILKSLEGAIREASDEFGEGSAKTDKYRIAANRTQASIAQLERSLRETQEEAEELGRDSVRIGRQLEDGIGDAADDVSDKLDRMVRSLESDLSDIGKSVNISAVTDVGGAVADSIRGAYDAVTGLVTETNDYNRAMSFLAVNAAAAGHSFDDIKQYAIGVAGLTGDMDAAIEGMSALLKAGFETDEMATAVERLSGAIIQLPDTMKFENLAESLLESVSTGSAVGQYAEYLEKMGMNIEVVNEALANAKKNGQEAAETAALALLSGHGAEEVLAQYKEDNADLVAFYTAQAALTDAQANLAREITPTATALIEFATDTIDKATELVKLISETNLEENEAVQEAREENLPEWEEFIPGITTDGSEAGQAYGEEFVKSAQATIKAAPVVDLGWDAVDMGGYETGVDEYGGLIESVLGIGKAEEKAKEEIKGVANVAAEAALDLPAQMAEDGDEAGAALVTAAKQSVIQLAPEFEEASNTLGQNAVIEAGNGMAAQMPVIASTAAAIYSQVESILSQPIVIPVSVGAPGWEGAQASGYLTGTMGGSVNLSTTVTLDGRSVGKATSGSVNSDLGAAAQRASTYGR